MKFFMLLIPLITQFMIRNFGCSQVHQYSGNFGIAQRIQCPHNGFMSGIKYRATEKVETIEVICTSFKGRSKLGPYGDAADEEITDSLVCPEQHYISSFFGTTSIRVNSLGVRCRHKNDINSGGIIIGEFGQANGTSFDELTQSLGSWPVSVNIKISNATIGVFKGIYSNSTSGNISKYNSDCDGDERQVMHGDCDNCQLQDIECPDEGVIIGISYTFSIDPDEFRFNSIKFTCSSSAGLTYYGPFGTNGPSAGEATCPENYHINYFTGRAGDVINELHSVCAKSGQAPPESKPKDGTEFDVQKHDTTPSAQKHPTNKTYKIESENFDDFCFGANGKRPVKLTVGYRNYVEAINIIYEVIPVAFNCNQTQIELTGDTTPKIISYEILGLVVGSSCTSKDQQLRLSVEENKLRSDTTSNSHRNSFGTEVETGAGVVSGAWFGAGVEAEVTRSLAYTVEEGFSTVVSLSNSNEIDKTQSTTITYQGPGASFLVGFRSRYEIKKESVDILYHSKCERGSTPPVKDKIFIGGQVYGSVHFQDFYFPFGQRKCTTKLRMCISRIKLDAFIFRAKSLNERLSVAVNQCFMNNQNSELISN